MVGGAASARSGGLDSLCRNAEAPPNLSQHDAFGKGDSYGT